MFGFRWRSRTKAEPDRSGPPYIRTSPSLPELASEGIPWPENLVDPASVSQADAASPSDPPKGAAKTLFRADGSGPIAFHKPWSLPDKPAGGTISALYTSPPPPPPPSAFETRKQPARIRTRVNQRKVRAPTSFNVMVVGAQGTGKTSLLRLLLDTADVSPTATPEQKASMDRFLNGRPKRTESIQTTCVEICESRYDRILLSVIDTPGLDFHEGHELRLERQVTGVVKYLDAQFADTLSEESKVVRQSKGDQHVHLCIYMIDPKSIMSTSLRRALSSLPEKTRSQATISHPPDLSSFSDDSTSDDSDDESSSELTMSPADLRVIKRLSTRANVLPVIAHADSLTDDTLAEMKRAVRRDLHRSGLDFGVFGPVPEEDPSSKRSTKVEAHQDANGSAQHEDSEPEEEPVEERRSRPVIKLRPTRHAQGRRSSRSRSRSRMSLSELAAHEQALPDTTDAESIASVRFSAHVVFKNDLGAQLPFALISPERIRRGRPLKPPAPPPGLDRRSVHTDTGTVVTTALSEDGHAVSTAESTQASPVTPTSPISHRNLPLPYLAGPPADLKGMFTRKFRWGTIDVLNPAHCDFAAMRIAVLSTHLKMLKIRTREVLYEQFRTEKLLAKRATSQFTEAETRKLLADLGI
ncbi:uncharacterized protein LAESUDRAFT_756755 [Laetiporus sulphureus 93-53]|uniref:Septin-type G domain-containing protein n=1 Tax=Laetiporus sulphureus 93-53 TaxID=1314785 RepID=A0A165FKI6_9APHY|nr:uncharacterized protein LAESUDRAFT_756755 [Laetiporus sulphureus 93-53]KZT09111.1 hypothetical protein LAESUDRAFT_756755 [Laetiporus sulphureus 93-53]